MFSCIMANSNYQHFGQFLLCSFYDILKIVYTTCTTAPTQCYADMCNVHGLDMLVVGMHIIMIIVRLSLLLFFQKSRRGHNFSNFACFNLLLCSW